MPLTRSGRAIGTTAKKIKFSDDGELPSTPEVVAVRKDESENKIEISEESEDDSDEAPEEESVSRSKSAALSKMKQQEKLKQELRKQEREKRKQRDLHFKQQQEAKRDKIKELVTADELPDLLPEEALESDEEEVHSTGGKHLRTEDFEKEDAAMRKKAKLEKLRNLKEMRKQALKKGPIYVQVQHDITKNRVPPAEQKVMESKSSWMQRESLNKK